MQKLLFHFRSALLTALGITILVVAPVAAQDSTGSSTGSSDSNSSTTTPSSTSSSGKTTETTHKSTTPPAQTPKTTAKTSDSANDKTTDVSTAGTDDKQLPSPLKADGLRNQAQQDLKALREGKQEHTAAQRQQSCTEHQADINNRITKLGKNAQKHLDDFSSVLTKVEAFQTKQQLAVANYDSLVATAVSDQVAATSAVSTLSSLTVTLDCTSTDPAASLATVKDAANSAKTALQAFRAAIKAIITALQAAKPDTTSTTGAN
jgi:hypothetical protein